MTDIFSLLAAMIEHDASDLYITVGCPPTYRVNGVIHNAEAPPFNPSDTESIALSILNEKQQIEFEREQELNIALNFEQLSRFRVNVLKQRGSHALVIRRVKTEIPSLEMLGLPNILKDIVMIKRGLVLLVGATGMGKSTTLAAMIDHRNTFNSGHIISVEDPIEFIHSHKRSVITQREVGIDTSGFHQALKNCLRQAPDVILIGEIRDTLTMECAMQFAETGHLCLATLHSTNASQAMERILNFFPVERHPQIYLQLSMNLRAIFSQRLIATTDGSRIPAYELLLDSPRVRDLILKGEIHELKETMEKSHNLGMRTFDSSIFEIYCSGKISVDEALRNADSAHNLKLRIQLSSEPDKEFNPAHNVSSISAEDFRLD
jgi:twitching motility protein PilU